MVDVDEGGFIERFVSLAERDGERVFTRFEGEALSFAHLHDQSGRIAAGLRRLGVGRGDRVAVMLANSPAALALLFALAKSGAVWVPLNVQLRADGLRYILDHAEPRMVIARADLIPLIRGCGASLAGATLVAEGEDDGVLYMWEPLYHIGGSQLIVLPLLRRVVLHMVQRFSAGRFFAEVSAAGATHIHFLGGILQILLKQPPSALDRRHGARIAWGGGCPPEVWRAVEDRFGLRVRECYGMTEASSFTTYNDRGVVGSVGRPVPWFSVELLGPDGTPVPAGERGEIVVRSRDPLAITKGYFRNPAATAAALRGGALHTGDLGAWDRDGNLFFHGRMSDSVRVKGENVSAWEVESVAAGHPAVEDCAMIGVAADSGEQDIKLFVKLKAGNALDPASLSGWLAERLAPYQVPRYVSIVPAFERTPSQRIMKHRLSRRRDDCWDRLAPRDATPLS